MGIASFIKRPRRRSGISGVPNCPEITDKATTRAQGRHRGPSGNVVGTPWLEIRRLGILGVAWLPSSFVPALRRRRGLRALQQGMYHTNELLRRSWLVPILRDGRAETRRLGRRGNPRSDCARRVEQSAPVQSAVGNGQHRPVPKAHHWRHAQGCVSRQHDRLRQGRGPIVRLLQLPPNLSLRMTCHRWSSVRWPMQDFDLRAVSSARAVPKQGLP